MGLRSGLNQKQHMQMRRLLGLGWDRDRIAYYFQAVPESLDKAIAYVREHKLVIQPRAGTANLDKSALKAEIRAEIMAELRAESGGSISNMYQSPPDKGELPLDKGNDGDEKEDDFDYSKMRDDNSETA